MLHFNIEIFYNQKIYIKKGLDTYAQSTCLISGPAGWTTEAGCSTAAPCTVEQKTKLA